MRPLAILIFLTLCLMNVATFGQTTAAGGDIIIGTQASDLEQYAAKELQRYLYQLSGTFLEIRRAQKDFAKPCFIIGQTQTNPIIAQLASKGAISASATDPGPQGYVLKKLLFPQGPAIVIAGSDESGCLYGVYGLLTDYYHVGFFLSGDILPDKKSALTWVDVDERNAPSMYIRGFLPWTNFPQSATSYSWEDWKFILDQMAKMRLNFIHIHNYNGELGHNEMFHNFVYKGYMSRVWMPTARQAHAWAMSPWDVNQYRFGATDLFDDYDFGADCALHNEGLGNEEAFRKSASLFQKVIDYAHSRAVKVGLGLDIDLIPKDYKASADDAEVIRARVDQLAKDYPTLDFLLCFQSENVGKEPQFYEKWRKIFTGFYDGVKSRMPNTRLAVAGWGLNPASIATLPKDVICAPISYYSDRCETGAIYGDREYWGCPWLERDFYSSEYYYPYNLHLSNTISAFNERAPNMRGFYCLTWRLTDAVEPKMWYIARAPWDQRKILSSSSIVYEQYANIAYGADAAKAITQIIDQNEPFAVDYAECEGTPPFARLEARGLFQIARFSFTGKSHNQSSERSAATFSDQYGVGKNRCEEGGECLDWIDAREWARYQDVDFGIGATIFEARVASATQGGIIELRLDSMSGPLLGSCRVLNTGGLQQWTTVRCEIKETSGRRTLQMNFRSDLDPFADYEKAERQIDAIDEWIAKTQDPNHRVRLSQLRCRIAAVKEHIALNREFEKYRWTDLPGAAESWVKNFTHRVTDISTLGNVMSMQNRYIQRNYVAKEETLRAYQAVKAPGSVSAKGTSDGALISWKYSGLPTKGFRIYRDGHVITETLLPPSQNSFVDRHNHRAIYQVSAVDVTGKESPLSVPSRCAAGSADTDAPLFVVISPPTSHTAGQPVWIKARTLDNRKYDLIAATLFYRSPGEKKWNRIEMDRKVKAIFTAAIPAHAVTERGVEYYLEATDGTNRGVFPPPGSKGPLTLVTSTALSRSVLATPSQVRVEDGSLMWTPPSEACHWYRVYRSRKPDFAVGPATFVTYVSSSTTSFKDKAEGFDGETLKGEWYYRISAVSRQDFESKASRSVKVTY
jgi:hypothetical protein